MHWTTYLSPLLVPIIAIFGALIAYRQWRTAQNKLKLDLFDRRLVIYESVQKYLTALMISGKTTSEMEFEFLTGKRGAQWLFNEELTGYLDKELWRKICALGCIQSELEGMPAGQERKNKVQAKAELREWFVAQSKVIDEKFAPFLRLSH
ncbi:hypothetical protein [Stutzerimonas nitrititolerans]|uniref:hypothetical protein n=1 Tax=Stutzerimonas nitrititolerans TaxID=2482751 RepID=UPI0028AAD4F9|nr:hypothetical protein [Stutzerimonas nitrititolerans]